MNLRHGTDSFPVVIESSIESPQDADNEAAKPEEEKKELLNQSEAKPLVRVEDVEMVEKDKTIDPQEEKKDSTK